MPSKKVISTRIVIQLYDFLSMSVFGDELCPHRELIFAESNLTSLMSEFFDAL